MTETVYTLAQLNAIKKAYASGVLRVNYDGTETLYRSLSDMQQIINTITRALNAEAGKTTSSQVRMKTSRGLDDGGCE